MSKLSLESGGVRAERMRKPRGKVAGSWKAASEENKG